MSGREERVAHATATLTSPAFVLAVAVLAVNDHVLKPAFGNWVTGKLSDVAGLLAFALFWCALLPRRRDAVLVGTALAWMAWKSPLADAPLALWNASPAGSALPLARVLDYGDWIALVVLPVAWRVVHRDDARDARSRVRAWRRVGAVASAMSAVVAFGATTVARPAHYVLPAPPGWTIDADRVAIREELRRLEVDAYYARTERRLERDSLATPDTASLRVGRTVHGGPVYVRVEMQPAGAGRTRLALVSVSGGYPRPQPLAVQRVFLDTVIAPLRARFGPATPPDPYGER
jgi:hypothetical protein